MGSSSSTSDARADRRADRRASRNQSASPAAQSNSNRPPQANPRPAPSRRGPPTIHQQQHAPPMPMHLMQHQHPSFQNRPPPQATARPTNMAAARVTAEVKDAKNVEGFCTIHSKKVKVVGDCISFVVTTTLPVCDYEIHVAIRETIRKGEVIFTPNRAKQPPQRITIEGEHDDLELVVPLELDQVSDQEKQYIKEYPKQIPMAIALRYVLPNGQSMVEYTYIQLLPKPKVFRQLIQTPEGVFKVESMFGGDDDGGIGTAVVAQSDSPQPGQESPAPIEDDGEDECVICLTELKDTVVLPCRHLCVCKDCAERLRTENVQQKCPVCRAPIEQLLHIDRHKD